MTWTPIEIKPDCLNVEAIVDILCQYRDANDLAEDMLNSNYGTVILGIFSFLWERR